jgi:hypothetical protein
VATASLAAVASFAIGQVSYTPIPVQVQQLPAGATYPQVVSSNPVNGSTTANAGNQNITITFDQAMNVTTFYYNYTSYPNFPTVTQAPYWTNGNRTFVIPVTLNKGVTYQIPLNVYDQAFKSAVGVALPAGYITFTTGTSGSSSFSSGNTRFGGTTSAGSTPISSNGSFAPATGARTTGAATGGSGALGVSGATGAGQPLKLQNQGQAVKLPGQGGAVTLGAGQGVATPAAIGPRQSGAAQKNIRKLATPTPGPQ